MATRSKLEMHSLIKEAISELFANEEFLNRVTKTILDKVERKLLNLQTASDGQEKN